MPRTTGNRILPPPLNIRQTEFVSSVELRTGGYLKPFSTQHYYRFKRDPRWPEPFIGDGGKEIYSRASIDKFLARIAEEGFDDSTPNTPAPPPPHPAPLAAFSPAVRPKARTPKQRDSERRPGA